MQNMTIRNFQRTSNDEKTLATFDLCLRYMDFEADICNCRVVNGQKGPFASLPSFKREDKWYPTVKFIGPDSHTVSKFLQDEIKKHLNIRTEEIPF